MFLIKMRGKTLHPIFILPIILPYLTLSSQTYHVTIFPYVTVAVEWPCDDVLSLNEREAPAEAIIYSSLSWSGR